MADFLNSWKIVGITFEPSIDKGIPKVALTCLRYRENTNPNIRITATPVQDCSLTMLSYESKTRNTIIAINGNKYAATFKYLKQKDQVFRYYWHVSSLQEFKCP